VSLEKLYQLITGCQPSIWVQYMVSMHMRLIEDLILTIVFRHKNVSVIYRLGQLWFNITLLKLVSLESLARELFRYNVIFSFFGVRG
jgi:hypothetical protein